MHERPQPPYVAVVGPADAQPWALEAAHALGDALAHGGVIVVCGGLGGVMEAACRGAVEAGGTTLGLLPRDERADANPWVTVAVPTGLGELRNGLVVRCADVVVAISGGLGTLSEIALALKLGRPVIGVRTWDIAAPVERIDDVSAAARRALELVTRS